MSFPIALATLLLCPGSYRDLEGPAEAEFYRTRGEAFLHQSLHVHLPGMRFLSRLRPAGSGTLRVFDHRRVVFAVPPSGDPYFQQFLRKARSGGTTCLSGRVVRARIEGRETPVFLIQRIRARSGRCRP